MHVGVGEEIAPLHIQLAFKKLGTGLEAQEAEQAEHAVLRVGPQLCQPAGFQIFHHHPVQYVVALAAHFLHSGAGQEAELGGSGGLLL